MKNSPRNYLRQALQQIFTDKGFVWPEKVSIEPPKDKKFGDLACNIALTISKEMGKNPRAIAEELAADLLAKFGESAGHHIIKVDVAGPGFLNVTLSPSFWFTIVQQIEESLDTYGSSQIGKGRKVMVEFVSANPTGPLHIGHGRGAAVGDALARVCAFAGFNVTTEYYINDAGRQMLMLGTSVWFRAMELANKSPEALEEFYRGEYIIDISKEVMALHPDLLDKPRDEAEDICFQYAMTSILDGIKQDLKDFNVHHEEWFSERSLVESGVVEKTLESLKKTEYIYEKDGALWFATSTLGDDKDRVLRKSDGSITYFASDIAYHANKINRGFEYMVDVWGADHHGYINRMKAAITALGKNPEECFSVVLIQLVNLMQGGEQIAMSTRAGQFETLADVVKEVGVDAARFMFLWRKHDSPLDFDLALVRERSMSNPVYYVQYAHARICALLRKGTEVGVTVPAQTSLQVLQKLEQVEEIDLIRKVAEFPQRVSDAAINQVPHQISYYLMELAGLVHSYYANVPVLNSEDKECIVARLALLRSVGQTIKNGLCLLGVSAPESM